MQDYKHNSNDEQNQSGPESYQADSVNPYHENKTPIANKSGGLWGYFLTAAISVFLTAAICFGLVLTFGILRPGRTLTPSLSFPKQNFADNSENQQALDKLSVIIKQVQDNYYEELSDQKIIQAMTEGMLEKIGSPYTFYLSPEYVKQMEESMSGSYSGIGATVEQVREGFQISDLVEDSPAEKAALLINDVFMAVDGKKATEFEDVNAIAMAIRGEDGSQVEIKIYRPSQNKEFTFKLTRTTITNSNIHSAMVTDEIGYVRIVSFNQGVSDNFIEAMDKLQAAGAKNVIFDVRNNGGGYVDEVLNMLDYLLPEGPLITEVGRRNGKDFQQEENSDAEMGVPDSMHYICLINKNSASASELFSGSLRDWDKAKLVGEQSFGKGVGSITNFLTDGSAVQITNFYYNLPSGENINEVGLKPDFPVELPEDQQNITVSRIPQGQDKQLEKAIDLLKNK